jgi:predicted ester cyclase
MGTHHDHGRRTAPARRRSTAIKNAQSALAAALERWNAGDLDGYLALYDERIRLHGYSPEPMSKVEVREFYDTVFNAFDNPRLEFHQTLWEGSACAIRFRMTGTHVGAFMGVPPTGRPITLPGITILDFDGTAVIERFSQADMLGLLVALGAVPASA